MTAETGLAGPGFLLLITTFFAKANLKWPDMVHMKSTPINSLRPSDAIWRQWFWTTLAQVMACCLTAPNHYLNQCWLIIRGVLWHTSESSFAGIAQGIDSGYEFEKDILKNIFKSPRGQWVKALCHYMESVNQVRIGSGNDLSPVWQQAITWSNAHLLLIRSLMINFTDIWINIWNFFFEGNPLEN